MNASNDELKINKDNRVLYEISGITNSKVNQMRLGSLLLQYHVVMISSNRNYEDARWSILVLSSPKAAQRIKEDLKARSMDYKSPKAIFSGEIVLKYVSAEAELKGVTSFAYDSKYNEASFG